MTLLVVPLVPWFWPLLLVSGSVLRDSDQTYFCTSMAPSDRSSAPSKLLLKLHDAMDSGKFYEAHQLLKTINFRYTNSGKYEELEELLVKYATVLLSNNQIESGCDVAIMLSKLYNEKNFPVLPNRVSDVCKLLEVMPPCPERITYLMTILEWCGSSDLSGKVHSAAVILYTNERYFSEAWKHLIRLTNGTDASILAPPIFNGCQIRREELDIAISLLVLSFLAAKKIEAADKAFVLLVKEQVRDRDLSPLLHGVRFLIEAAKMNCPKAFTAIKEVYDPSFRRDNQLRRLVGKVGKSVFKLVDRNDKPSTSLMPLLMNAFLNPDPSHDHDQTLD
ncbi:unnamed protein product [Allacma fusca]|uniref:Clathrin/coatomer adaptor adaptin-like N-terminal domain-containing protein n=1 Tax=Allacma fusca TaxID=39272 RepID=A0A8J2JMB2_9HEXA|nr:unnamed protein product [Allacma fusca]